MINEINQNEINQLHALCNLFDAIAIAKRNCQPNLSAKLDWLQYEFIKSIASHFIEMGRRIQAIEGENDEIKSWLIKEKLICGDHNE